MKKKLILFLIGALGYCMLELLSRGYTHWSMGVTGGVCLLLLDLIWEQLREKGIIIKSIAGAVAVTVAELIAGLVVNVWLGLNVWSYAGEPFNFMGQICIRYSLTWLCLSFVIMVMFDFVHFEGILPVSKKQQ